MPVRGQSACGSWKGRAGERGKDRRGRDGLPVGLHAGFRPGRWSSVTISDRVAVDIAESFCHLAPELSVPVGSAKPIWIGYAPEPGMRRVRQLTSVNRKALAAARR